MFISQFLIKLGKGLYFKIFKISFLFFLHSLIATVILFLSAIFTELLLGRKTDVFGFSDVKTVALIILLCLVCSFLLTILKIKKMEILGEQIKNNLRVNLLKKLFYLGPAFVIDIRTGHLASLVTSRCEWVKKYYIDYLPVAISSVINLILILIFLCFVDFISVLSALFCALCMIILPHFMSKRLKIEGEKEWSAHDAYMSECLDSIQGIITLKSYNAQQKQQDRLSHHAHRYRKAIMTHLKITVIEGMLMEIFIRMGLVIPIMISILRVEQGVLRPEYLIYIFYMSFAAFHPLLNLINAWHIGFNGMSASDKISEFLDEEAKYPQFKYEDMPDTYDQWKEYISNLEESDDVVQEKNSVDGDIIPIVDKEFDADIIFDHVSFSYHDKEVLHNISFTLKKGTMTALIGSSGSGKSTIAKLLGGFYFPTKGKIYFGEEELSKNTVYHIQEKIGAVWQNSHLFHGSIKENLKIGDENAKDSQIRKCMEEVNLLELTDSLEHGCDTSVLDEGNRFSGGERQRIAIARCYMRQAPILIFDEATSSLDRKNEIIIQKSFRKLKKDKTSLVIAHRLSTIYEADQIMMLENGEIVANGTHKELIEHCGAYRRLMAGQIKEEFFEQ